MGRVDDAVRHFRKALEIDGSFAPARAHLRAVESTIGSGRGPADQR
jgi:hypothetical protein